MKKIQIFSLVTIVCVLIFIACNSGGKEKRNERNENESTEIKKDSAPTAILPPSPAPSTYSADRLPPGVKEFVNKNYVGYRIETAAPDPLCGGGPAIDVAIAKTGAPNLSLIFKPDGSYVQQEEDVPLSTASDKIRSTLKTKFGDYSAGSQIEKLTLADKSIQYLVDLSKGKNTKEVIFTIDGSVVCEN
jgi:hypothetical protein